MDIKLILFIVLIFWSQCVFGKGGYRSGGHSGSSGGHSGSSGGHSGSSGGHSGSSGGHSGKSGGGWFGSLFKSKSSGKSHNDVSYPDSSTGLSGNNHRSNYHQNGHVSGFRPKEHYIPSLRQTPQYVYVTEYRQSNSKFSDILTGLTLYNLGRSRSHHHYYYNDDYSRSRYRHEYESMTTRHQDDASCSLRIEDNNLVSRVKVPCEIVSTFNSISDTDPVDDSLRDVMANCVDEDGWPVIGQLISGTLVDAVVEDGRLIGGSIINGTLEDFRRVNCTASEGSIPAAVDPLKVTGPALSVTSRMRCWVEVKKQNWLDSHPVDCEELIRYSKMPEGQSDKTLVPSKDQYQSWMKNPPSWLALFFIV